MAQESTTRVSVEFAVLNGNVADADSDILVLKYAQAFHGADQHVASILNKDGQVNPEEFRVLSGESVLLETRGAISPSHVLFLGVPELARLRYGHIYSIGQRTVTSTMNLECQRERISTTIHGVGVRLNEAAAFLAQLAGILEALRTHRPSTLRSIAFVERDGDRFARLRLLFEERFRGDPHMRRSRTGGVYMFELSNSMGGTS